MKKKILLAAIFLISLVFLAVSVGSAIEISIACRRPPSGFDGGSCVFAQLWASCLTAVLSTVVCGGVFLAFGSRRFWNVLPVGLGGLTLLYATEALSQFLTGHAEGAKTPAGLAVMWIVLAFLSLSVQRDDQKQKS